MGNGTIRAAEGTIVSAYGSVQSFIGQDCHELNGW